MFAISWRNPGADMRDTSLDDYRTKGVMAAHRCGRGDLRQRQDSRHRLLPRRHAADDRRRRHGARRDKRLASLTLFAAQTDFTEAGELELFITEDQLDFLNDMMRAQGYLDSAQMGGAFQMLRSNDLVWSHAIRTTCWASASTRAT